MAGWRWRRWQRGRGLLLPCRVREGYVVRAVGAKRTRLAREEPARFVADS